MHGYGIRKFFRARFDLDLYPGRWHLVADRHRRDAGGIHLGVFRISTMLGFLMELVSSLGSFDFNSYIVEAGTCCCSQRCLQHDARCIIALLKSCGRRDLSRKVPHASVRARIHGVPCGVRKVAVYCRSCVPSKM